MSDKVDMLFFFVIRVRSCYFCNPDVVTLPAIHMYMPPPSNPQKLAIPIMSQSVSVICLYIINSDGTTCSSSTDRTPSAAATRCATAARWTRCGRRHERLRSARRRSQAGRRTNASAAPHPPASEPGRRGCRRDALAHLRRARSGLELGVSR